MGIKTSGQADSVLFRLYETTRYRGRNQRGTVRPSAGAAVRNTEWTGDGGPILQYCTINWIKNKTFEASLVRKKIGKITYLGGIDISGGYYLIFSEPNKIARNSDNFQR